MLKEKPVTLPHVSILNGSAKKPDSTKTAKKTDAAKVSKKPINNGVIVFGRDEKGKAHASRFDSKLEQEALRAAHVMGFKVITSSYPAMTAIAEDLPDGRLFRSGKAFVPFVKEGVCIALEAHANKFPKDVLALSKQQLAELENEQSGAGGNAGDGNNASGAAGTGPKTKPTDSSDKTDIRQDHSYREWQAIKTGDCVLACDVPEDGWWESIVQDIAPDGGAKGEEFLVLTLKWRDCPEEGKFTRKANQVALLHPAYVHHEEENAYAKAKGKA